jgi:hypothetical protein
MLNKTNRRVAYGLIIVVVTILLYYISTRTTFFDSYVEYRVLTDDELIDLTNIRRQAYSDAIACSRNSAPDLTFDDVRWELTPGNILRFPRIEGRVLELKGWFNPNDSTIYIPFTERETRWILVHESLHAIGYRGHPPHPFRTCNAMADQNP